MKKQWIIGLAVIVFCVAVIAVGLGDSGNTFVGSVIRDVLELDAAPAATAKPSAKPTATATPEKNKISGCVVTIEDARLAAGYDEEPILIVAYTFANNSNELKSFGYTVSAQVFQDGVECGTGFPKRGEISDAWGNTSEVKPNATVTVERAYELKNLSSSVSVELRPWVSSDAEPSAAKTFALDQLQS